MGLRRRSKLLGNQSWSEVLRDFSDGGANGLLVNILGGNEDLVNDFLRDGVVTAGKVKRGLLWSGTR